MRPVLLYAHKLPLRVEAPCGMGCGQMLWAEEREYIRALDNLPPDGSAGSAKPAFTCAPCYRAKYGERGVRALRS